MANFDNTIIDDTGFLGLPRGTVAQRPTNPSAGMIRYNTELNLTEWYDGTEWLDLVYGTIPIVQDGLNTYLDAAKINSYPGSGVNWFDLSPYTTSGTLTNGPTFNSEAGGCIVFDGSNDLVSIPHQNARQNNSSLTISAWVKPTALVNITSNAMNIVGKTANAGYRFRINGTLAQGGVGSVTIADIGATNILVTAAGLITAGNWHFITMVGSPSGLKIYVNGTLRASNTTAFGGYTSTGPLVIGAADEINTFGECFYGRISMVLLYLRELSDTEIVRNYNATRGRFGL
jgi:hypothetical protein